MNFFEAKTTSENCFDSKNCLNFIKITIFMLKFQLRSKIHKSNLFTLWSKHNLLEFSWQQNQNYRWRQLKRRWPFEMFTFFHIHIKKIQFREINNSGPLINNHKNIECPKISITSIWICRSIGSEKNVYTAVRYFKHEKIRHFRYWVNGKNRFNLFPSIVHVYFGRIKTIVYSYRKISNEMKCNSIRWRQI